jgi:hypothetical protein
VRYANEARSIGAIYRLGYLIDKMRRVPHANNLIFAFATDCRSDERAEVPTEHVVL